MVTIRDRLWLWGHATGSHNPGTGPTEWNLPGKSTISPAAAAYALNIPNLLMIRYDGRPSMPYDQLAKSLNSLERVAWGITGAMGESSFQEREHVLNIASRTPNISGLVMDDFINWDSGEPELSVEELLDINRSLVLPDRTLDLMMILYSHQLNAPIRDHLDLCNQVSLWVWDSANLVVLPEALTELEERAPRHDLFLGCYLWDLGPRAPMPLDRLQRQCQLGLEWLKEGRITGMIFLASCYVDLGLDTVSWLQRWLHEVGEIVIPQAAQSSHGNRANGVGENA